MVAVDFSMMYPGEGTNKKTNKDKIDPSLRENVNQINEKQTI